MSSGAMNLMPTLLLRPRPGASGFTVGGRPERCADFSPRAHPLVAARCVPCPLGPRHHRVFERHWAEALLARTLARLKAEHIDRAPRFEDLKIFLLGPRGAAPLAEVAARLGVGEGSLKLVVYRLRQRYAQIFPRRGCPDGGGPGGGRGRNPPRLRGAGGLKVTRQCRVRTHSALSHWRRAAFCPVPLPARRVRIDGWPRAPGPLHKPYHARPRSSLSPLRAPAFAGRPGGALPFCLLASLSALMTEATAGEAPPAPPLAAPHERVGDYELLEELGRGGHGRRLPGARPAAPARCRAQAHSHRPVGFRGGGQTLPQRS
jgi:hypothetical protein